MAAPTPTSRRSWQDGGIDQASHRPSPADYSQRLGGRRRATIVFVACRRVTQAEEARAVPLRTGDRQRSHESNAISQLLSTHSGANPGMNIVKAKGLR